MISRSFAALFVFFILISCSKQKHDDAIATDSTIVSDVTLSEEVEVTEDYDFTGESLKTYEAFLHQLDKSEADNMVLAADKFKSLFTGKDHATCDSAFYLFETFYSSVTGTISSAHDNDTTNYDSLVSRDENGELFKVSRKLQYYHDKLERNGFELSTSEGFTYIGQNREFVKRNLYDVLSPLMVKYLEQLNQENKEGYGEDGGLVIEPTTLVDRAVWWERFNKENPAFLFKFLRIQLQKSYTSTLVTGVDNTPLFFEAGGPLDDYYKTAYKYLLSKYADSETAKLLRPYYTALVKSDTAAINAFRKNYP